MKKMNQDLIQSMRRLAGVQEARMPDLASEDKQALRDAAIAAIADVLADRKVVQMLNEAVEFPERFNRDDALASIQRVTIDDGKMEIHLNVGSRKFSFAL